MTFASVSRAIRFAVLFCMSILTSVQSLAAETIFHVNASLSTGANDGSSWDNAFQGRNGLQAALTAAAAEPGERQIWVAAGTYAPAGPNGDPDASFLLQSGIGIYGGFAGTEAHPDARDVALHPTILTGDLNGNDAVSGLSPDNSRHVVRAVHADASAILDGLIIRSGYANGHNFVEDEHGAGLYAVGGAPTIRNCEFRDHWGYAGSGIALFTSSGLIEDCRFINNEAQGFGAGIGNFDGGSPTIRRCRFEANVGGHGGGIYNGPRRILDGPPGGAPRIEDCDFISNRGVIGGGSGIGMFDARGAAIVTRCRFFDNKTGAGGGGVYLLGSAARITSCDFVKNEALGDGGGGAYVDGGQFDGGPTSTNEPVFLNCRFNGNNGAVFVNAGGRAILTNCTITHSSLGIDFLFWPAIFCQADSRLRLRNCILWGNKPFFLPGDNGFLVGGGDLRVDDSCVEAWDGSFAGAGTIAADPLFVHAAGVDGLPGTEDDAVQLSSLSPCRDAGETTHLPSDPDDLDGDGLLGEPLSRDLIGAARVQGCQVDMGAYEHAGPLPHSGDLNNDAALTFADVPPFVEALLAETHDCLADLNADGATDARDMAPFIAALVSP